MSSDTDSTPRRLAVELGARRGWATSRPAPWRAEPAWIERIGRWSGGALGLAALAERAWADPRAEAPLAISVGELVRRGFPTAARASVASRAPLTGLYSEGLVGGDLARRLATVCDLLLVSGRAAEPGAVLVVTADGQARVEALPALCGMPPRRVHVLLNERFGSCATLSIGVAGERGLPIASLAAGGDVPHFVGRGGLGAVLGKFGLKAIAVVAPEVAGESGRSALVASLSRSPRLLARAEGGTLELFEAFAQRAAGGGEAQALQRLSNEARAARSTRQGCRGCPTPCGWVFDTQRGATQGARFGASHALSSALGFARLDDALELLALCDELGLDAKEVGAGLALLRPRDVGHALALVRELADGSGDGARLAGGAAQLARELGLPATIAKGAAVRADASLASLLGQCVSSRGGDPMRTFPFLAVDGADLTAFRASTGLELPERAGDPLDPAGKGRLVAWHEDWANALDAAGFCAFSAAALIADGVLGARELGEQLAPRALAAQGLTMLDAGAALSALQRRLNERWGSPADADRPEWARAVLDRPGMWDEYARSRGLDGEGRLLPERVAALERLQPWHAEFAAQPERAQTVSREPRAPGRVRLNSSRALPGEVSLALPAPLAEVLAELARVDPAWADARPAVFRAGQRLGLADLVRAGERLELTLVVAGG